jgi:hypothetical protein
VVTTSPPVHALAPTAKVPRPNGGTTPGVPVPDSVACQVLSPGVMAEVLGRRVGRIIDQPATPPGNVVDTCDIYGGPTTGNANFPYQYEAQITFAPGSDPGTKSLDQSIRQGGTPLTGTSNVYQIVPGKGSGYVAIGPHGNTVSIGVGFDTTSQTSPALVGNPNIAIRALIAFAG